MNRKFFYSKSGVRIISLVIAIFLYIFVANENSIYQLRSASNQQFASVNVTETLSNVPVAVGPIDEDMFISGLPESAQVRLTGPRNVLNQVLEQNIIVETEDLTDREPGPQYIRLVIPDLPSSVDYQITPSRRYVRLSLIKTVTLPIEYELDEDLTTDAYEVKDVTYSPKEVELTGDVDIIDQIDRVYFLIKTNKQMTESFTQTYSIRIVDSQEEVLDVNANISEVEASIQIGRPEKAVSINLVVFGEDNQYNYEYQLNAPETVKITGNKSQLAGIDELDYIVDVTDLNESANLEGRLQIPRNVDLQEDLELSLNVYITPKGQNSYQAPAEETNLGTQEMSLIEEITTVSEENSLESEELTSTDNTEN